MRSDEQMGVIEDVYEDVDADVAFDEFAAAVEQKVEQMGGLADEETAAMLVAHELDDDGSVSSIADVEPGMEDVSFLAKVASVGELRTFERDGDDRDGRVANVELADESGRVTVSFWDRMAEQAVEQLARGDVIEVAGRPKEGYDGLEVAIDDVNPDPDGDVSVDVSTLDRYQVDDLQLGASDVTLTAELLATEEIRTFDRDDGSEGRVSNLVVGDETGRVRVTLWDEAAGYAEELTADSVIEISDGYVRERDGDLELHVGSRGEIESVSADVHYEPETTPIGSVEMDQTVDIAGGVVETGEKRTFDRDDGSQGQVRNVRLKDDSGEIRVALWGEKADLDISLADRVVCTDVEIQDGWQDDLEASAGWGSTVHVTSDDPADTSSDDQGGLGSFTDSSASAETDSSASAETDSSVAADGSAGADSSTGTGGPTEFTGTVVQAGSPAVLDDGTETKRVETDETLRLGEEVTVRGPERDGTIEADDVF